MSCCWLEEHYGIIGYFFRNLVVRRGEAQGIHFTKRLDSVRACLRYQDRSPEYLCRRPQTGPRCISHQGKNNDLALSLRGRWAVAVHECVEQVYRCTSFGVVLSTDLHPPASVASIALHSAQTTFIRSQRSIVQHERMQSCLYLSKLGNAFLCWQRQLLAVTSPTFHVRLLNNTFHVY
jgi:hypothetical protein